MVLRCVFTSFLLYVKIPLTQIFTAAVAGNKR